MNGARGLRRFAPPPLAARDAATRLVTSRADHLRRKRAGEPWRPVSLRWRQPRRLRPDRVVVRAVTTTRNHWSPRAHVLGTLPANAPARSSAPAMAGSKIIVSTERRFLIDRRAIVLRGDGVPARAPAAERRIRLLPARTSPAADLRRPALAPARAAASNVQATEPTPRLRHRFGSRPFAPPYQAPRVGAAIVGGASPTTRGFTARRELTFLLPRPAAPARPDRTLAREDGALPVRLARPADIAWRRPPRSASEPGGDEARSSFPPAAFRSLPRSPVVPDAVSSGQAPTGRTAPAPAAQVLDPVVLERLTDDVIRRVERRVRIDRERRGL